MIKKFIILNMVILHTLLQNNLFVDGRKNKVLNNKINLKIPVILFHGKKMNFSVKLFKKILKSL